VRTTIDLPDELYRALKVRAALNGTTLRDLTHQLLEQGLRQSDVGFSPLRGHRGAPPVIGPLVGVPIPALTRAELRRLDDEEDEAAHARSARR
jgi:hypothetical protein